MHIATSDPLPALSRLRIEVIHGDRGFLVEGVVAHRRIVHRELAKVMPTGMGVRFLTPGELVTELLPPEQVSGAVRLAAALNSENDSRQAQEADPETRTFSVRFASAHDFLGVYERDILNGGLFVATGRPGRLREVVQVELYPPVPAAPPVVLPARVVQRFQPQPGSGAILVGMGVELLDLPGALEQLQPLVDLLEV